MAERECFFCGKEMFEVEMFESLDIRYLVEDENGRLVKNGEAPEISVEDASGMWRTEDNFMKGRNKISFAFACCKCYDLLASILKKDYIDFYRAIAFFGDDNDAWATSLVEMAKKKLLPANLLHDLHEKSSEDEKHWYISSLIIAAIEVVDDFLK